MNITPLEIASRMIGQSERPGPASNALILAMLQTCDPAAGNDEIAWCSAVPNFVHWLLGLPRTRSLAARSWLDIGEPVNDPQPGCDLVILWRGSVDDWRGHVGWYVGEALGSVQILGGNQSDRLSIADYPRKQVLGYRRFRPDAKDQPTRSQNTAN